MKYKDWLCEWLETYVRPRVKARTYERYALTVRLHIAGRLGGYDLEELTPLLLQEAVSGLLRSGNRRTGAGLSAAAVNTVVTVLQGSLRAAHLLGFVREDIAGKLMRPRSSERRAECFSVQEQKRIEGAVLGGKKQKMYGVLLCLYSGLRIGELLALQWSDVDLHKGTLAVSRSCHDGKGGLQFDEPKTASSRRTIPLPKQLLPVLRGMKRCSDSPFVISAGGKPVCVRSYQRSFELLLKKLHIPHRGFHSLRHTFATRALECGMDVKTLSEILGHKNPTVTLNRYAHSLTEHKANMMNRLGKMFAPKGK